MQEILTIVPLQEAVASLLANILINCHETSAFFIPLVIRIHSTG